MARLQRPTPPNDWLYKEESEDKRQFASAVYLPNGTPDWFECTQEEREQWEHDHPVPQPESEIVPPIE